jgi:hypothetical protein
MLQSLILQTQIVNVSLFSTMSTYNEMKHERYTGYFINILTSGRFRSQKDLDNKILNHINWQKLPYRFFHY